MVDDRKLDVLRAIVEDYVATMARSTSSLRSSTTAASSLARRFWHSDNRSANSTRSP